MDIQKSIFFADHDFADFKKSLDAEMKRLQSKGLGSKKRQAEPLSLDEEEILWENGLLGDKDPHQWTLFRFEKWTRTQAAPVETLPN